MEKEAKEVFRKLTDDLSAYAEMRLRLLRLTVTERTAKIIAVLSHGVILILFVFFSVLFLFLALGFFLGEVLGSLALGFLITGLLYLLLTALIYLFRDTIRIKVMNIVIGSVLDMNNEDRYEQEKH